MTLPRSLEDLILDYYWSHRMYVIKQKVHRELLFSSFVKFVLRALHYNFLN